VSKTQSIGLENQEQISFFSASGKVKADFTGQITLE
jgi:hypothetical protein